MLELENGAEMDSGAGAAQMAGSAGQEERPLLRRGTDDAGGTGCAGEADNAAGAADTHGEKAAAEAEAVRQGHWQDFVRQQQTRHSQEVQRWRSMTAQDPEIGGDRLSVSVARAQWALNRFDPQRVLGQWMEESGLGNHPEVIRFFNRVADAVGDDVVVQGRVAREMPSLEERMYPHWKV